MKMRTLRTLLSIVLLLTFGLFGAGAGQAFAAPVKILALGTSLTQGYGLPPGGQALVLVRPDGYVAGRWRGLDPAPLLAWFTRKEFRP